MTELHQWRTRARYPDLLGYFAAGLAYLVAGVHLFHPQHGFVRLVTVIMSGNLSLLIYDPRPIAFVLSAVAILLGIKVAIIGTNRTLLSLAGMGLMATYVIGYFAWHLSGHGGFLPVRKPLYHGLHPVTAVISHLITDQLAALAKVAEALLFAVLAVLHRHEP